MTPRILDASDPRVTKYVGLKAGRLTAVQFLRMDDGEQLWRWSCECGKVTDVRMNTVKRGNTTSCGCLGREATSKRSLTHGYAVGHKHARIYRIWSNMRDRCEREKNPAWKDYGGRGITVCERWSTFEHFLEDMLPGYRDDLCIERIENDKGYSKENCKWATAKDQALNRRTTQWITFNGVTLCIKDWAAQLGMERKTLSYRLRKWGLERAMEAPLRPWAPGRPCA